MQTSIVPPSSLLGRDENFERSCTQSQKPHRDFLSQKPICTGARARRIPRTYRGFGRPDVRLTSGALLGINGTISYTHDAVGNRLTRTSTLGPIGGQAFVYDANDRIAAETYDSNGNVLASDGDVFQYDFEDRLTAINGGVAISYDASGNIGSRTEGGTKVSYLVDELSPTGYTQVVEEVTAGAVSKTYAYGQMPLRSGTSSYVQDGHTDVRALVGASGVVTDEYDYEAFGVGTRAVGGTENALRYTGERTESGGLTFLRARHLRNGSGRFVGMDPWMGNTLAPSTLHRFGYADGLPVDARDPSGRVSVGVALTVVVAIGVLASITVPGDTVSLRPRAEEGVSELTLSARPPSAAPFTNSSTGHVWLSYDSASFKRQIGLYPGSWFPSGTVLSEETGSDAAITASHTWVLNPYYDKQYVSWMSKYPAGPTLATWTGITNCVTFAGDGLSVAGVSIFPDGGYFCDPTGVRDRILRYNSKFGSKSNVWDQL